MDWLDQYLHELNRTGAVMHFPPDKPSWHAPVPSKQQLSLIQDATVADMVRMRNIQEARQMEIDAGMGGGYDAGSAAKERATVSPVAPSGISLTAPTIYVSGLSFQNQAPFNNGSLNNPFTLITPGFWGDALNYVGYVAYTTQWELYAYTDYDGSSAVLVATNTAPAASLPTTGWVNTNANLIVTGTLVISTTP